MFLTGQATSAEKTFGQISFCTCLTDVWAVKIAQPELYFTQRLVSVAHYTTMVRRRKLSEADRGRAVAWIQSGFTYRTIAGRLGVSPSVICRLKQRLQTTGRLKERPRPGRPRLTDVRTDRFIVRQALTKRTNTANRIRNLVRVTAQPKHNRKHFEEAPTCSWPFVACPCKTSKADAGPQGGPPGVVSSLFEVDPTSVGPSAVLR